MIHGRAIDQLSAHRAVILNNNKVQRKINLVWSNKLIHIIPIFYGIQTRATGAESPSWRMFPNSSPKVLLTRYICSNEKNKGLEVTHSVTLCCLLDLVQNCDQGHAMPTLSQTLGKTFLNPYRRVPPPSCTARVKSWFLLRFHKYGEILLVLWSLLGEFA